MTSHEIHQIITGPEKDRFIKQMGIKEYNKLVTHLEKLLKRSNISPKDKHKKTYSSKKPPKT